MVYCSVLHCVVRTIASVTSNNSLSHYPLPFRILSFDGGGTRGVLSIAMLKEIMGRISPNEKVQPYELFDIICGTSTGGIIAVLLGAQRRSVAETEALYDEFIDKVRVQPLLLLLCSVLLYPCM